MRAVGHQVRRPIGGLELAHVLGDDLPKVARITGMAPNRLHQHGNPRVMFHHQGQHHVVQVMHMTRSSGSS